MTTSRRAKFIYISLFLPLCAVIVPLADRSDPPVWATVVAASAIAAMFVMPSLALRCRHCGARQVGFNLWGYFFVGDRCRRCFKRLDGPAISDRDNELEVLRESDPALADALAGELRRQARLKTNAFSSRDAAAAYRLDLLWRRVDALALLADHAAGRLPQADDLVADAHRSLVIIDTELAKVDAWLGSQAT